MTSTYLWYFKIPKEYTRFVVTNDLQNYIQSRLLELNHVRIYELHEHKEFYYGYVRLKMKLTYKYLVERLPKYFTIYPGDLRTHRLLYYKIIVEKVFTNGELLFK